MYVLTVMRLYSMCEEYCKIVLFELLEMIERENVNISHKF